MDPDREFPIREGLGFADGPVVYWMSRDQRVSDNWALLHAQETAIRSRQPLAVIFCLVPDFLGATQRQYGFMLKGLEMVEEKLAEKGIPFILLTGDPSREIPRFLKNAGARWLYTDFDPLRIKRRWKAEVSDSINLPFTEVDAHNIVPCRIASPKLEWAAYTLRPKIRKLLDIYLKPCPSVVKHPWRLNNNIKPVDWDRTRSLLKVDRSVKEVSWCSAGEKAARQTLASFIRGGLSGYGERSKDPGSNVQSHLSPYLHFGHISPARVALEVKSSGKPGEGMDAFLEELIVRRELADNHCFYNSHYDSVKGFPEWARKTLKAHRADKRPYLYELKIFDSAATHDQLWNAAQVEMVERGKMHGYLRMYWAKKILEWTGSPEEAMDIAIRLNDRYELDGRDPNGYTGIAWSIGGVHDRAWGERPVFGKVRYMGDKGVRAKFDARSYIKKWGR